MCGDFWQLHPVLGTFLASDFTDVPAGRAQKALSLFWEDGDDSIRSFWELKQLMRCNDIWYNAFLGECRRGSLPLEQYCYLHGLPTLTSPCARCSCNADVVQDSLLGAYRKSWKEAFLHGHLEMEAIIQSSEMCCAYCQAERSRRHRVLTDLSALPASLRKEPFSAAPALYTFNVPRYFSTNLRAREFAKQGDVQLTWCYARDVPLHPGDRELADSALQAKLFSWLRRHDQETSHLPSVYPLAVGMPIRLTENVDRGRQLFRGHKGFIHGWALSPGSVPIDIGGEFMLDHLPAVIYLYFPEASVGF